MDHVVSGVGVLDKAMYLLDAVAYSQPVNFPELVSHTGLPKTTAHRLIMALEMHGFLCRDGDGRLVTGSRSATGILSQISEPILRQLTIDTSESSQVFVRRGQFRLCVASVESPAELRATVPVGSLLVIERGSAGKLLSGADEAALRRGWAESVAERVPGVASVSAPIYDSAMIVAALCLSGPIERLGRWPGQRFGLQVVAAAEQIQRALVTARD